MDKAFYVSPFMAPDMRYRFALTPPGDNLVVHMDLAQTGASERPHAFDATLSLEHRPWTAGELRRVDRPHVGADPRLLGAVDRHPGRRQAVLGETVGAHHRRQAETGGLAGEGEGADEIGLDQATDLVESEVEQRLAADDQRVVDHTHVVHQRLRRENSRQRKAHHDPAQFRTRDPDGVINTMHREWTHRIQLAVAHGVDLLTRFHQFLGAFKAAHRRMDFVLADAQLFEQCLGSLIAG